jgi:prefoldin subunit 5
MGLFKTFKLIGIYSKAKKFIKDNKQTIDGSKEKAEGLANGIKELIEVLRERVKEVDELISDCKLLLKKLKEAK